MGCVVKKLHEPVAGLIACAFLEKTLPQFPLPNFSATAEAIHWSRGTPSSCARRCAAFLIERGIGRFAHRFTIFNNSGGRRTKTANRSPATAKSRYCMSPKHPLGH